jgi:chromosome segregation ATPase
VASSEYAQLVEFLGARFTAVDQRFTAIDGRFDALERQVAGLRQEMLGHFDEGYRRLERLEQEYHAITQALRRIEAAAAGERGRREILERDLAELKQQVAALQSRINEVEQRLES